MQRIGLGVLAAEPFPRLDPGRMRRAIVVAEARDLLRIELDPAGRRAQLVLVGIGAEIAEEHVFLAGRRNFQIARAPRTCRSPAAPRRWRRRCGGTARRDAAATHSRRGPACRSRRCRAARASALKIAKSLRASPTGSIACCMAMMNLSRRAPPMSLRSSDVVAGSTMSAWRAVAVHHGSCTTTVSGLLPGAAELVGVLMMMERIAAGPIDQPDVRIVAALAVEVERRAGIEQAIGDARRRDRDVDRILDAVHRRRRERQRRIADAGARAVAEAEAAARQPDLAERRGEQHHRPVRLLAVMRALQRPRRGHHRARRRHAPRQRADRVGRNAGDRRGPVGVLRLAVALAHQIGQHALEADAVTCRGIPGRADLR